MLSCLSTSASLLQKPAALRGFLSFAMAHTLPSLPFDSLKPIISDETLEFHHGKHHNAYVTKLNAAVKGKPYENWGLDDLIVRANTLPEAERPGVFNNAAQHYNHSFYWKCMKPGGGGEPAGALAEAIKKDFGSFDAFAKQFTAVAGTHFGSGWGWLVKDGDKLKVMATHDADTPIAHGVKPLLTCDVWEHAYYIDYRNARPKYVDGFMKLINWDFVAQNL